MFSRNIGICLAQGDIVAFIDDDAIPEPEWLEQLAQAFADPGVGAVGGKVYNHTGYDFQYQYSSTDRMLNVDLTHTLSTPQLSFPLSHQIPYVQGCNCAFRKTLLLKIKGFDEEYEYYADETDVCIRITDSGYQLIQHERAYVHHKFAPSDIREVTKVTSKRYSIIKNKLYFALKHGLGVYSLQTIIEDFQSFIEHQKTELRYAIENNLLAPSALKQFEADLPLAIKNGYQQYLAHPCDEKYITEDKITKYAQPFLKFTTKTNLTTKNIVIISKRFPPHNNDGIAQFNKNLAESLAQLGHIVHIITESDNINRVDFVNGVWVHRALIQTTNLSVAAQKHRVPKIIWDWSVTALKETRRINSHRNIDILQAPIWDCEGIAFILDQYDWPIVTSLQTTLYFWLNNYPQYKNDKQWLAHFGKPMIKLEKFVMQHSFGINANSHAIKNAIEKHYHFKFKTANLAVIPLGIDDKSSNHLTKESNKQFKILFVGRFEYRKGIDVILNSIPEILSRYSNITFDLIGKNDISYQSNKSYKTKFEIKYRKASWYSQVNFLGQVSYDELDNAYNTCNLFIAPSRFESFGLVYIEAMRAGKVVIGCNVGGAAEIITDKKNGLLIHAGDKEALINAIEWALKHPDECKTIGQNAQQTFHKYYTAEKMAQNSIEFYQSLICSSLEKHEN
jgi:glycosyltransferase involved in cell wall biosynthesis